MGASSGVGAPLQCSQATGSLQPGGGPVFSGEPKAWSYLHLRARTSIWSARSPPPPNRGRPCTERRFPGTLCERTWPPGQGCAGGREKGEDCSPWRGACCKCCLIFSAIFPLQLKQGLLTLPGCLHQTFSLSNSYFGQLTVCAHSCRGESGCLVPGGVLPLLLSSLESPSTSSVGASSQPSTALGRALGRWFVELCGSGLPALSPAQDA